MRLLESSHLDDIVRDKILEYGHDHINAVIVANDNIENYCCPIKILQRNKNRADFICEVSPFLLDFCRQTKSIQLWAKVYILADSRSMVR